MTEKPYPTLDDVLIEFVAEFEQPTDEAIKSWIYKYPEFEREIINFSATWIEQEILPGSPEFSSEEAQLLVDRAISRAQNILFEQEQAAASNTTEVSSVKSLISEAQKCGIGVEKLVQDCNLDKPLLSKLDKRMIIPSTIPIKLVRQFAILLHRTIEVIENYFNKPATMQSNRAFLAREKPQMSSQQDFAEAVRQSSLSEEQKSGWLSEIDDLGEKDK